MSYADLHLHTTCSDGTLAPIELVMRAQAMGFAAIAVTGHDTTDCLNEALKAAATVGIELIPGLELSTLDGEHEIHLLGYFPDRENSELQHTPSLIIAARHIRAVQMVKNLMNSAVLSA